MSSELAKIPSLPEAAELLMKVSDASDISEHTVLLDADIDSIDFVEWMAALGFTDVELDDAELYDLLEEGTFKDLYDAVVRAAGAA